MSFDRSLILFSLSCFDLAASDSTSRSTSLVSLIVTSDRDDILDDIDFKTKSLSEIDMMNLMLFERNLIIVTTKDAFSSCDVFIVERLSQ
jgi:hypothetical protein